ncbi:hypothetical protein RclHR1_03300028 [Rhizophagus clarus]|uniref:Kinase-like domain-containing protein n=1 Tax=Rhizophagus clarus TaxID=94130 RepID=A0A2Z6S3U6_9GLOM|nr:hypothetical protein RclHR1_03300028 [Rhizophagus clarus]GES77110.1 kinase-like domain-containing protein [Rhizophagus clarus]
MNETANQLLSNVVPDCAWIPPRQRSSSIPAYPLFPEVVRQWRFFSRSVNRHINNANNIPGGQFPVFATETISLSVEDDTKYRLYTNVLMPVNALLGTQGAVFRATCTGLLGTPDFVLCTNNSTMAKMPVEMKTRHNLNLGNHDLWEIYRHADRAPIMETDPNFRFKKRILSQVFGEMACNGLYYGILSNYTDTYFLQRLETEPKNLYVSHVVHPNSINPTLRECIQYISHLAINDQVGRRLDRVLEDINSFNDDSSDDDDADDSNNSSHDDYAPSDNDDSDNDDSSDNDYSSKKRKSSSMQIGSRKRVITSTASSSKGITTIGEYIGGGTFGKVFSGYYDNQAVAWKTCDTYKKKEEMKTLKHEAHVYSILRECQGHAIPRLHYKGYIYGGFLFALALQ